MSIRARRFIDTVAEGGQRFAVLGLGQFGRALARNLSATGAEVLAADCKMDLVEDIKDEVAYAVQFDATDAAALQAHALDEMDAVIVAIGTNFEACLLTTVELMDLGARRVIARATTATQRRILEGLGVQEILSPEQEMGRHVAKLLTHPDLVNYFDLAGDYDVEEVRVPPGAVGERLADLALGPDYGLNVITIRRPVEPDDEAEPDDEVEPGDEDETSGDDEPNGELRTVGVPHGKTRLEDGDTLVIFGRSDDIGRFLADHE